MPDDVWYFGCWQRGGHYWWWPGMRPMRGKPLSHEIDAKYPPRDQREPQGIVTRTIVEGWTILAFWDRSVDPRYRCNSAFGVRGEHDYDAALAVARTAFPQVFARLPFALVPAARPSAPEVGP